MSRLLLVLAVGFLTAFMHAQEKLTPAEKIRKALDQPVRIDYSGNSLQEIVNHLKKKAQIPIIIDQVALQMTAMGIDDATGNPLTIDLKSDGNVRQALQRLLGPYHLTFVTVGDSLLITTEELGLQRQMRQRLPVDVTTIPLEKALKELARTNGINLVIDPRAAKEAQTQVTLQLDDTTVETAVRVLAEIGGLKAVRMGNVLFVTQEDRAHKIQKEESIRTPTNPMVTHPLQNLNGIFGGGFGGGIGVAPVPGIPANPIPVPPGLPQPDPAVPEPKPGNVPPVPGQ